MISPFRRYVAALIRRHAAFAMLPTPYAARYDMPLFAAARHTLGASIRHAAMPPLRFDMPFRLPLMLFRLRRCYRTRHAKRCCSLCMLPAHDNVHHTMKWRRPNRAMFCHTCLILLLLSLRAPAYVTSLCCLMLSSYPLRHDADVHDGHNALQRRQDTRCCCYLSAAVCLLFFIISSFRRYADCCQPRHTP